MDDVERALDDAINTFKVMTKDEQMVPGGGAAEIELAKQLTTYGEVGGGGGGGGEWERVRVV